MIVLQATPHRIKRIWHGDAVGFSALGLWNSYVFLLKVALMQTHECIRLKTVTRTPTPVTFLQNWWLALFPLSLSLRACRLSFLPVLMSRSCYGFGCGPNPNLKDVRRLLITSHQRMAETESSCFVKHHTSFIPVQASVFSNQIYSF